MPGSFVGIIVDEVREIIKMEDDNMVPVPKGTSPSVSKIPVRSLQDWQKACQAAGPGKDPYGKH
ncbi:MAG: hypothetical protein ACOX4M_11300 [Acetivibrionales bacterium]